MDFVKIPKDDHIVKNLKNVLHGCYIYCSIISMMKFFDVCVTGRLLSRYAVLFVNSDTTDVIHSFHQILSELQNLFDIDITISIRTINNGSMSRTAMVLTLPVDQDSPSGRQGPADVVYTFYLNIFKPSDINNITSFGSWFDCALYMYVKGGDFIDLTVGSVGLNVTTRVLLILPKKQSFNLFNMTSVFTTHDNKGPFSDAIKDYLGRDWVDECLART